MADHDYVDLVVAEERNTKSRYVVQCPAWKSTVGGLVEFEVEAFMNIGEIISRTTVSLSDDKYKFISEIDGIIPCVRVWGPVGDDNAF